MLQFAKKYMKKIKYDKFIPEKFILDDSDAIEDI